MRRKVLLPLLFLCMFSVVANAQNNSNPPYGSIEEVKPAWKVLKLMMQNHFNRKNYNTMFIIYFSYTVLNASYLPPPDVRNYMTHIYNTHKPQFTQILHHLEKLNRNEGDPTKSRPPTITKDADLDFQ